MLLPRIRTVCNTVESVALLLLMRLNVTVREDVGAVGYESHSKELAHNRVLQIVCFCKVGVPLVCNELDDPPVGIGRDDLDCNAPLARQCLVRQRVRAGHRHHCRRALPSGLSRQWELCHVGQRRFQPTPIALGQECSTHGRRFVVLE